MVDDTCDGGNEEDDGGLPFVYFLESAHKQQYTDRIHRNMQQIDMQETGSNKSVDLARFDESALGCTEVE